MYKANKIKPNLISNYLSLGMNYLLQDQIEKSTSSYNKVLSLTASDSGEALEAEVDLAVNNLIKGDFKIVEKHILNFTQLFKKKVLDKIKSKTNKKHIAARSNYLKHLYPLLKNTQD